MLQKLQNLEKGKGEISAGRFSQLRNILEDESLSDGTPEEVYEKTFKIIGQNKENLIHILEGIRQGKLNNGKTKEKQLTKFLTNFIANLTKEEITELHKTLQNYKEIYEYIFGYEEEISLLFETETQDGMLEICRKIFLNSILLPEAKDQKEFNKEMSTLFKRLKNSSEKINQKKGLSIQNISPDYIREDMEENGNEEYEGGENLDGPINTIVYYFQLGSENTDYKPENFSQKRDDCYFQLDFISFGNEGVNREDFINILEETGCKKIENSMYLLKSNLNINIGLKIYPTRIHSPLEGDTKEQFMIEIFSESKRNIDSYTYLEQSVYYLSEEIEKLAEEIYKRYGYPSTKNILNLKNSRYTEISIPGEDGQDENFETTEEEIIESKQHSTSKKEIHETNNENQEIPEIILGEKEQEELSIMKTQFLYEEYFEKFGIDIPRGVILYGPPGTGKTLFAEIISKTTGADFRIIDSTQIHTMRAGMSEKNLKKQFDEAKKAAKENKKVVLFFDEADGLFEKRTDIPNTKEGMMSIILQEMDGIKKDSLKNIMVFFTTNKIDTIDPALVNRCDKRIKIELPDRQNREEILRLNVQQSQNKAELTLFEENIDRGKLAKETEGKSGRFINKTIQNTVRKSAFKNLNGSNHSYITTEDILQEMEKLEMEEESNKTQIGFLSENSKK